MWGHRFDPTPHPDGRRREHFPCQDVCRKQGTDQLLPRAQLARNCALSGVDTGAWTSERLVKIRMGAPARYDLEGKSKTWKEPEEDPREAGCPGSWVRCEFVRSVLRYYRRRTEGGGRVENLDLTHCNDPLIHQAIQCLESWEDIATAEAHEKWVAAQKAKQT